MMKKLVLLVAIGALFVPCAFAQLGSALQTSKVSVTVAAEAGLTVPTDASLTSLTGLFANYTGNSTFTYYLRTSTGGHGTISLQVTGDFSDGSNNAPSVAKSGGTGDTLTYLSAPTAPATTPGVQTASTSAATSVAVFSGDAHSLKGGTGGNNVAWTLVNDPAYPTGTYSATITWTISAA